MDDDDDESNDKREELMSVLEASLEKAKQERPRQEKALATTILVPLVLICAYSAIWGCGYLRQEGCGGLSFLLFVPLALAFFCFLYLVAVACWKLLKGETLTFQALWVLIRSAVSWCYSRRPTLTVLLLVAIVGVFYSTYFRYHTYKRARGFIYVYDRLLRHGQAYFPMCLDDANYDDAN
jgi:hypothetical protein